MDELPYEFVAVRFVGGTEKLRGAPDYGVPLVGRTPGGAEIAVDLSDEPVLDPRRRSRSRRSSSLPESRTSAPTSASTRLRSIPFDVPSLAVIGTGKRVGKTAVTAHVARLLARDRDVVVVAMGRGGPPEPELVSTPPTWTN